METNFLEIIRTRRSCRCYKPEQITDGQLNAVLEAGKQNQLDDTTNKINDLKEKIMIKYGNMKDG